MALLIVVCPVLLAPSVAGAQTAEETAPASSPPANGGAAFGEEPVTIPEQTVPGKKAVLMDNGYAAAPADAPREVKEAIWAANRLQDKPYGYGGGHADFEDDAYDCSGTVSYALNAAGLLKRPRDSSSFMRYGKEGRGKWITIYTNPGHAYVVIAGLRLDTSQAGSGGGEGPRWRPKGRPKDGFTVRHPRGF